MTQTELKQKFVHNFLEVVKLSLKSGTEGTKGIARLLSTLLDNFVEDIIREYESNKK